VSASTTASHLLLRTLRRSAPGVTRAVVSTALDPVRRRALVEAIARLEQGVAPVVSSARHPMAPAAVRIERSRSRRRRGGESEQVAVTMWFGEGPALPAVSGGLGRGAVRVGAGVLSAAALAAATTFAARLAERPARPALPAPLGVARIEAPEAPSA
jgi:hypothetical protein